ncbi:MAG: glycosyltransferase family 39 protein [Nitrosomonadales bacterium]|nr:glycosyltransferase family 39 protein [Nitrosomonadales bacterium]
MNPQASFKLVLLATLAVKLVLAWILPMSGDEAYFIVWAKHPDFGFYDHPPMVGWILQLLLYFGSSEVVLRLPAILLSTLIGIGIYQLLKPHDETRAALVAMLFLVSPLNVLNVLVTTDTPLILFVFLSAASLLKALQKDSLGWYALSGAFFGLAFLSKYFAALLGVGYLAYFIFSGRDRQKMQGFALLLLVALPFALLNLYWNYTHCWDNILFNFYTRNEAEQLSPGKVAIYLGTQVYLMTPPIIYYLFRHRAGFRRKIRRDDFRLFACAFLLPMAVFALLSPTKVIGLHWVLAFYPFLYVLLHHLLSREELVKSLNFMAWFCAAHLAAIAVIAFLPMETWKNTKLYDGIVFMFKNDEIVERVRPYEGQQFLLAADGYTPAAIISYHYGRNFFVFGEGSLHARQDDMVTDFRQFAGRNILIVKKSAPDMAQYRPYFKSVESRQFELRGVTFHFVLGYGFDYGNYRNLVLKPIKDKYYHIPAFLPHAPCYFCEKYFPEERG